MLVKIFENYGGEAELKSTFTITNGNAVSFTRKERVKNFTFSSGLNLGKIYQVVNDNFIDDWKAHTGLFGKPCKNLNTEVKWSDSESITQITFDFDDDGLAKVNNDNINDDNKENVNNAIDSCPVAAIEVIDDENKEN